MWSLSHQDIKHSIIPKHFLMYFCRECFPAPVLGNHWFSVTIDKISNIPKLLIQLMENAGLCAFSCSLLLPILEQLCQIDNEDIKCHRRFTSSPLGILHHGFNYHFYVNASTDSISVPHHSNCLRNTSAFLFHYPLQLNVSIHLADTYKTLLCVKNIWKPLRSLE